MGTVYFLRKKRSYLYLIKRDYITGKQKDTLVRYLGKKSDSYIKVLSFLLKKKPKEHYLNYDQKDIEKSTLLSKSIVYKILRQLIESKLINHYYLLTGEVISGYSSINYPKKLRYIKGYENKYKIYKRNVPICYYFDPDHYCLTCEEAKNEFRQKIKKTLLYFDGFNEETKIQLKKSSMDSRNKLMKKYEEKQRKKKKEAKKTRKVGFYLCV